MKKLMLLIATAGISVVTHAAAVGWSAAGMNSYANDAYLFFVVGQNSATIDAVTTALGKGEDVSSYALGSGKIASNGSANVAATAAGQPTLGAGTYTAFYVIFDSATPSAGESNYALISGQSGLTQTVGDTSARVTFAAANVGSYVNNASNWKSFGPTSGGVPEPTSGLLLLVGAGMLALRRKQK